MFYVCAISRNFLSSDKHSSRTVIRDGNYLVTGNGRQISVFKKKKPNETQNYVRLRKKITLAMRQSMSCISLFTIIGIHICAGAFF